MKDVECPYCGTGQEINHDDGYGYEEDDPHEQSCPHCDKTFVFTPPYCSTTAHIRPTA